MIHCAICRRPINKGKRYYHGDQDDIVCATCAKDLTHSDTAYAGTKVSHMPFEYFGKKVKMPTLTPGTDLYSVTKFVKVKDKCPYCKKQLHLVFSPGYPQLGEALYCKHCKESF